ncbi:MAG: VOC family protein [Rhodomicrobium sp.]
MQLNPYLFFDGRCEEAFKFYEKTFGGKIKAMFPHEGTPAANHVPPDWRNKIMHASLEVAGQVLMGSDASPQHYHKPQGFSVSISINKVAEAERVFAALAEGGHIRMPLEKTFWAARFGMVADRFGIPWMINCEKDAE